MDCICESLTAETDGAYVDDQDYWGKTAHWRRWMWIHGRQPLTRITRDEAGKLNCDMLTDIVVQADPPQKMFRVRVHHLQDVAYFVSASSAAESRRFVGASDNADRDFDCETCNVDWHIEHVEELHH